MEAISWTQWEELVETWRTGPGEIKPGDVTRLRTASGMNAALVASVVPRCPQCRLTGECMITIESSTAQGDPLTGRAVFAVCGHVLPIRAAD